MQALRNERRGKGFRQKDYRGVRQATLLKLQYFGKNNVYPNNGHH